MDAACAILQSEEVGFADGDGSIALEDAAGLLFQEELKAVTKDAKCAVTGSNKSRLIAGLMKTSRAQGGFRTRGGQLKLHFDGKGNYVNREDRFVKKILEKTGASCLLLPLCLRLLIYDTRGRSLHPFIVTSDGSLQPCAPRLLPLHGMVREVTHYHHHITDDET